MSEVVLYDYWRSSASYRVRIALNLLEIDYRTVPVNLLEAAHRRPDYLTLNPQGLVPTLVIDGQILTQSLAIIEYLAELRPECGLLPSDIADRRKVRALAYAVAMDIHPICNLHVVAHLIEVTERPYAREEWMKHFIADGLGKLEAMIGEAAEPSVSAIHRRWRISAWSHRSTMPVAGASISRISSASLRSMPGAPNCRPSGRRIPTA